MPIVYCCSRCGVEGTSGDELDGKTITCGACGSHIALNVAQASRAQVRQSQSSVSTVWKVLGVLAAITLAGFAFLVFVVGPQVRKSARHATCTNNLKIVALGMLNYEVVYGTLPPAYTVDKQGNPLHSWRTLILPYIEQQDVYDRIRLNEPWDSPHNAQIAEIPIVFFDCPSSTEDPTKTNYMVFVGERTPFPPRGQQTSTHDLRAAGQTILVFEAAENCNWMEPKEADHGKRLTFSKRHGEEPVVVFCDFGANKKGLSAEELGKRIEVK